MGRLTVQKGPDYFLQLAAKVIATRPDALFLLRSEERRVGKECRSRWSPYH